MDGASKWDKLIRITLPTIMIILILRMGSMLSVGYEKIILMYNEATYETADVISTYLYRRAFKSGLLRPWDYFYNSGGWDDYSPQKKRVHEKHLEASCTPVITGPAWQFTKKSAARRERCRSSRPNSVCRMEGPVVSQ